MRKLLTAAAFAALATTALVSFANAAPLGGNPIAFEGYRYGGGLPVGVDKNPDALRLLIKTADAMGQLRDNQYGGSTYLVIGDTTNAMRIDGDGTWNGQKAHVVLDWDYRAPATRLDVTNDAKQRTVQVAAGNLAWDEKTPGVFAGKASNSAAERLIIPYLMPSGVILLGRDSADVMKLGKDDKGRITMTVPVPKLGDGVNLVATLDADSHPVHTVIAMGGHTYTGDFTDFLADRMDMAVNFPHTISVKMDGKEIANLDLNWHQANPYLQFPVPTEVASK